MKYSILVKIGIIICYYHLSALATTDTLRLVKGSNVSVFAKDCYCDKCGHKIALIYQIPIISYLITGGKCPYCSIKFDKTNFFLELILLCYYSSVSLLLNFSILSVLVNFVSYELFKIIYLIIKKRKQNNFYKEYILSFLSNIFVFSLVAFLCVIYKTAN